MEMTIHTQFDPQFPDATMMCSFDPLPMAEARMGMAGNDSDPIITKHKRGEVRVTVPEGSKINRKAGPVVLEVPGMAAVTADEVFLFAKKRQNGFGMGT